MRRSVWNVIRALAVIGVVIILGTAGTSDCMADYSVFNIVRNVLVGSLFIAPYGVCKLRED